MSIILFEDRRVTRLHPITVGRPAYAISCGSYRLVDWIRRLEQPVRAVVRPHLTEIQRADFSDLNADPANVDEPLLLVNSRLVPSVSVFKSLRQIVQSAQPGIVRLGECVAAALLPSAGAPPAAELTVQQMDDYLLGGKIAQLGAIDVKLSLLEYPHDLIRFNQQIFPENLEFRLAEGSYREIADGVFAAAGAALGRHAVIDTGGGPIVLEKEAVVGPHCFLSGPAHLGQAARVIEHAAIKDSVSIGHTTKIGGEVAASIIEPYTNKQHHGFLGHSYLGSWINLGAGTCNSDLKNTYGQVKMEYDGEKVDTGMQFIGCIMGDYAKSAINTGIFTGKTVGACSMVYGFVTTNVPSFVNYARLFGQVTEIPADVMVATQRRMFQRRRVEQRPSDIQLIHDMFQLTHDERQLAGEPLSL